MALKDDLMELADRVRLVATETDGRQRERLAAEIVGELRGLAKSIPDDRAPGDLQTYNPTIEDMKIKARLQAQEARSRAFREEQSSVIMTLCVGGPAADAYVPRPSQMGEGNYTAIAGARYQLRGSELHYAPAVAGK